MQGQKILSVGCLATMVNEKYQLQIKGCLETWVPKCRQADVPVYFFCGSIRTEDPEPKEVIHLDNVLDDVMSATDKQWLGLKWMYENSPSKWYLLTGTDNYIFPKRILRKLEKHESEDFDQKPLYLGGHAGNITLTPELTFKYYSGSGFFLNHTALGQLMPKITAYKNEWLELCKWYNWLGVACDAALGYYAKKNQFQLIDLQGIYACDWRGFATGVSKCCFPVDYNKCLILHRCEYLDHHAIKRYKNNNSYSSLYYCFFLSQVNFHWRPAVSKLYQLGSSIKVLRDLHQVPVFGTFPVLRGLIDSLESDKTFISQFSNEFPIKNWLEMGNIKNAESFDRVEFLIVPENYSKVEELITPSVKHILTYCSKPINYIQLDGFERKQFPPSIYLYSRKST